MAYILFLLLFGLSTTTTALPLPDGLTALNSTEGLSLLYAATTLKRPWEEASIHFLTQQDESSCGRASATIVLNTLAAAGVPAPTTDTYSPFPYWTQDAYTDQDCVRSNCTEPCTLDQAARALNCTAGVFVEARPSNSFFKTAAAAEAARVAKAGGKGGSGGSGDGTDDDGEKAAAVEEFRKLIAGVCGEARDEPRRRMMVANFYRSALGMEGSGHFSPVVAYAPAEDLALVLDVARYKYAPSWVPVGLLFDAIDTYDAAAEAHRGVYTTRRSGMRSGE